ncbi:hypothetical protein R80B4_00055 [Fibrobacteres bacterium R8-0-B4]
MNRLNNIVNGTRSAQNNCDFFSFSPFKEKEPTFALADAKDVRRRKAARSLRGAAL